MARNGTKWTEGPGLPEPCRGGNTLLAFRFCSGGSAWESNPKLGFPGALVATGCGPSDLEVH